MVSTQQVLTLTFIYIKSVLSGLQESASVLSAVLMPAWVTAIFIIQCASAPPGFPSWLTEVLFVELTTISRLTLDGPQRLSLYKQQVFLHTLGKRAHVAARLSDWTPLPSAPFGAFIAANTEVPFLPLLPSRTGFLDLLPCFTLSSLF